MLPGMPERRAWCRVLSLNVPTRALRHSSVRDKDNEAVTPGQPCEAALQSCKLHSCCRFDPGRASVLGSKGTEDGVQDDKAQPLVPQGVVALDICSSLSTVRFGAAVSRKLRVQLIERCEHEM